jgi:hypothetical protein
VNGRQFFDSTAEILAVADPISLNKQWRWHIRLAIEGG